MTNFVSPITRTALLQALATIDGDVTAASATAKASTVARLMGERLGVVLRVKDYGAKGDNITDDSAAINRVIALANSLTFPTIIEYEPGFYCIRAGLIPVTGPTRMVGYGPRSAILVFYGNFDCITFQGTGGFRCADAGVEKLGIYCGNMTGGTALTVDFTQDFVGDQILISSPYNGILVRQSGDPTIADFEIDQARGQFGIKGYGTGASRNNGVVSAEIDKIDLLNIRNTIVSGTNRGPGIGLATAELLWIDGAVQTIDVTSTRLLDGFRGVWITNTPNVAAPLSPAFFFGRDLEVENPIAEAIRAEWCSHFEVETLWTASSNSQANLYFGPNTLMIKLIGGRTGGAWRDGIVFDGCGPADLVAHDVFGNSVYQSGAFSGVSCGPGVPRKVSICGGTLGMMSGLPTYTEQQAYGINNAAGGPVTAGQVDLRGNARGTNSGALIGLATCITA